MQGQCSSEYQMHGSKHLEGLLLLSFACMAATEYLSQQRSFLNHSCAPLLTRLHVAAAGPPKHALPF